MAEYQEFTTARTTEPHFESLVAQLRAQDVTAAPSRISMTRWIIKKETAWTVPQINAAQNILDNAPAITSRLIAQAQLDAISIFDKALVLTLLDQINILRANAGLTTVTPAQAIQAIRTKAGTL